VRSVILLNVIAPDSLSVQRLSLYDFLLLHSAEFADGPPSLHPATPLTRGELVAREMSTARAVELMLQKGLIRRRFSERGIDYMATSAGHGFVRALSSRYAAELLERSHWIATSMHGWDDAQLVDAAREASARAATRATRSAGKGGADG
jgi:hypothetical protein